MITSAQGICILFSVVAIGLAALKWHIIRDRRLIASTIGTALREPRAFWTGTTAGLIYLAIFMIAGGKGGRLHILFGRPVLNTTTGEIIAGLSLGILVGISTALLIYGLQVMESAEAKKQGIKILAAFVAVLAAFCP